MEVERHTIDGEAIHGPVHPFPAGCLASLKSTTFGNMLTWYYETIVLCLAKFGWICVDTTLPDMHAVKTAAQFYSTFYSPGICVAVSETNRWADGPTRRASVQGKERLELTDISNGHNTV